MNETKEMGIGDLVPDNKNCRKHSSRNIGSIVNSLQKVGAARSIVIDENNVILAGNGMVEAAGEAGITKLKIVEADGQTVIAVRRSGLTPKQKAELAISDNRTSELAEWDADELLNTVEQFSIDLKDIEFTDEEFKKLTSGVDLPDENDAVIPELSDQFKTVVEHKSEQEQVAFLEQMANEGRKCRALIA